MVVNSREKLNSTEERVAPTSIIIALSPVRSSVATMMSIEEVIHACKQNNLTEKEQREMIYSYLYNLIKDLERIRQCKLRLELKIKEKEQARYPKCDNSVRYHSILFGC